MFRTLASSWLSRKAARRVSRFIPNPLLRGAVLAGATFAGPMLLRRYRARKDAQAQRRAALNRASGRRAFGST